MTPVLQTPTMPKACDQDDRQRTFTNPAVELFRNNELDATWRLQVHDEEQAHPNAQEKTPSPNLIFEHSGPALEWNGFRMFDLLFTNVPQPCCKFIDFGANVLR